MNNKGYVMLLQAIPLTILLTGAACLFSTFYLYAQNQVEENARLTAVYLAQKEVAIVEGELLSKVNDTKNSRQISMEKNGIAFSIQTSLRKSGDSRIINTEIKWSVNKREESFSLVKAMYIDEENQ